MKLGGMKLGKFIGPYWFVNISPLFQFGSYFIFLSNDNITFSHHKP